MKNDSNQGILADHEKIAYEKLCDKRLAYDNLIWQTPILGITAQSFLYTIAFDTDNSIGAKIFSCILILILGIASIQLLVKHRYHEKITCKRLLKIEKDKGLIQIHNVVEKPNKGEYNTIHFILLKWKSFTIWLVALSITTLSFIIPIIIHYTVSLNEGNKIENISIKETRSK